jgi:hypothetical protein
MSLFQTMLVGIAGSLIGGIVAWLIFHSAGAVLLLRRGVPDRLSHPPLARRHLTHPGAGYRR